MVLRSLSTAYQGKRSEPANANPLQTACGVTGSAGSPIAQTHRYHAGSYDFTVRTLESKKREEAILFKLEYIIEELRRFFCSLQQVRNVGGDVHGSFYESLGHFLVAATRCKRPCDLLEYHFALTKSGT